MSATPYSEHVEEAVRKLLQAKELPSDELLVYLVKAQRLLESVELGLGLDIPDGDDAESANHVLYFVSAFTSELKALREEMPNHVAENGIPASVCSAVLPTR